MSKIGLFILVVFCGDVLTLIEEDFNDFSNTKTSSSSLVGIKDEKGHVDREKRKEIVKNYLETLTKSEDDWVDPYDMLSNDKHQSLPSQTSEDPNIDNEYKPVFSDIRGEVIDTNAMPKDDIVIKDPGKLFPNPKHQICVLDSIYISRWLKMLILKIETDSYFEPSALVIPLNSDSLSDLKTISTKTLNIGELDELVSNLISKTTVTSKETYDWATFSSNFGFGLLVALGCGLFAYYFYIFLIVRPIWTIFWCIIFISIFWHWMHLYQKRVAYKHAQLSSMQIPSECRKNDFSLIESIHEYIKSYFTVSDCSKYYEALMVDPFWEVSFSVAFSETVSAFVFQPMYTGSKAFNASMKHLFEGLPFTSIFIIVIFIFLLIIMCCNYRLKLPFFMGALEPGYTHRNYVEDVKPYKTLNAVGDLIEKSVVNIEKEDRKTSGLFQNHLLYKGVNSNSLKRNKYNENVISKQGNEEDCKLVDCYGASQLTRKECEKSLELDSIEYRADHLPKVGEDLKGCNFCENHVASDNSLYGKNSMCAGNDKCDSLSLSNNSQPTELADVGKDKFVESSCPVCESCEQKQNVCCGMSEHNNV